jgi:hypothetical protein
MGPHSWKPRPPEAHVRVTFVQFDDGSVWGDDKAVAEAMFQRTETLKYLQSLRDAYSGGGDYALYQAMQDSAISRNADHRPRFMLRGTRLRLLKLKNAKAIANAVDKDLATAEARSAWLR